jgi:hypothetical protein
MYQTVEILLFLYVCMYVACMGEMRNAYKVLVTKPEGEKLLGRHSHAWEDNIKTGLKEIECEGVD